MNIYEELMHEVEKGASGRNGSIPFPIAKMDQYVDIAKNTNYLIVGDTGAGKSTLAQTMMLNIMDWYFLNKTDDIKLSVIYFGMERKQYNYSAKWVSKMIFLEEGKLIPVRKILGRMRKKDESTGRLTGEYDLLTADELELVKFYGRKLEMYQQDDVFICLEGTHNPTGIKIFLDDFARQHGTITPRTEGPLGKPVYAPTHPNHIVLIFTDYVGVLDKEKGDDGVKKNRLDLYSSNMRRARDLYGFSPINIQQLSRQLNDTTRLRLNDVKPKLSDIADTSELARDSDFVLAIFEAWRYLPEETKTDLVGYDLHQLKDEKGYKYYRSLHVLKSSFDGDGIIMGCAFHPQTGIILPMPKNPKDMGEADYTAIRNGSYFLKN